jgi:hypothetical protein
MPRIIEDQTTCRDNNPAAGVFKPRGSQNLTAAESLLSRTTRQPPAARTRPTLPANSGNNRAVVVHPLVGTGRATSFNLTEQCAVKEIVAEGSPEHFPADAESFFSYGGLSQQVQSRFSHHIQIFRRMVCPRPAPVFPKTHVQKPVRTVLD